MLAIPWYFTSVTGQTGYYGWTYAFVTLLTVFWSLYTGTLIDKYSRKKIFIIINICGAILLNAVAAYGFINGVVPSFLVALIFAATVFIYNIHYPALYAFGQEITEKEHYGKTNSLFEIQGQATTIIGGAVGSLLLSGTRGGTFDLLGFTVNMPFDIKPWTLHDIFLMDGITYVISIILLALIRYSPTQERIIHTGSIKERIRMGVNYLKENPLIFWFGNLSHSIFVVLLVEVHLLLPIYINNHLHLGADSYASADIYYAIGALLAGIGIRKIFSNTSPVNAIILMMWFTAGGLIMVSFTKSGLLFFLFSFIIGITNAGTRVLRITYLFNHIPNTYMGRTGSVFQVANILIRSFFIGVFSIPFFSNGSNITWAFFIGGLFIILSVLPLMVKRKALEQIKGLH